MHNILLYRIFKVLLYTAVFTTTFFPEVCAQITVHIDAEAGQKPISPYIYGRNNSLSLTSPTWRLSDEDFIRIKDAGVNFFRESGGNNSTKYNWRRKLSSHPDWYNNVYINNWDLEAQILQKRFPGKQGLWAFQLIGYAAKTNKANFNDKRYKSQWWEGTNQNLAGNGIPDSAGTKAKTGGDYNLYLEKWNSDSTVGILDHWFGSGGLGLDRSGIRYWSMDNEPEIWSGTHDDVMPQLIPAEEFMQRYFSVAKKARQLYPDIKLLGPVAANEWQWYNWDNKTVLSDGRNYPWLEFFIKRIAEEQMKSGIRLLDVLDIHFYPATKKEEEVVQLHRVFFDETYSFPEANGVRKVKGTYDKEQTREYIFKRINEWLITYLGKDHGVTLGLTESGIDQSIKPSVTAVWYASMLGEFMKNSVEICTPWTWKPGMWETLHLFSRYNQPIFTKAISADENLISAYPTINETKDSMTVVVVNRSVDQSQTVTLEFEHFQTGGKVKVLTLSELPAQETFISHTKNALKQTEMTIKGNSLPLSLPAMSVTSIQLSRNK
jgi:hypothetical protein